MFCWFCAPALVRSSLTAPAPEFVVLLGPAVPLPLVVDAAPPPEFAGTSPGPLAIPPGVPCMPVAPPWLTMMSVSSTSGAALQAVMISCGCRVNPATTPVALLLVSTVAPGGGAEEAAGADGEAMAADACACVLGADGAAEPRSVEGSALELLAVCTPWTLRP